MISWRVLGERTGFSSSTDCASSAIEPADCTAILAKIASAVISTSALTSSGAIVLAVLVMVVSNASVRARARDAADRRSTSRSVSRAVVAMR